MIRISQITRRGTLAASAFLAAGIGTLHAETVKLDDGTTCTVIESTSSAGTGSSSSVTVGNGDVTSSTTVGGQTMTMQSGSGSVSSSAGSSVTSGNAGGHSFSTASLTRPDGSVVTRRSDGTCDITRPR
jgi:hypothetical protein